MKPYKSIEKILLPPTPHWVGNGFKVNNFFPGAYPEDLKRMSPFFLLDYNAKQELGPSKIPRGVGVHPHRGIETVTLSNYGRVAHHDSAGHKGTIYKGDVQWMTAGGGVLHKEYIEKTFNSTGGTFQMVQLWVNLPAKFKMAPPKYQTIENYNMGKVILEDNESLIEIVSGEYRGIKGPAVTFSPVNLFVGRLKKGAVADFSFPENYNTGIMILEGKIKINKETEASNDRFVLFNNDGTEVRIEALEDATCLLMNGEPIDEPIAPYGPFLMNTMDEIRQAYTDYENGKFGVLED
jgi:redox-sensitive bicupin YhaK (pirin superfamily)